MSVKFIPLILILLNISKTLCATDPSSQANDVEGGRGCFSFKEQECGLCYTLPSLARVSSSQAGVGNWSVEEKKDFFQSVVAMFMTFVIIHANEGGLDHLLNPTAREQLEQADITAIEALGLPPNSLIISKVGSCLCFVQCARSNCLSQVLNSCMSSTLSQKRNGVEPRTPISKQLFKSAVKTLRNEMRHHLFLVSSASTLEKISSLLVSSVT
jgi:hypothetical protein